MAGRPKHGVVLVSLDMSSVRVTRELPVQRTIRDIHVPVPETQDTTPNPLVFQGRAGDIALYNHPIRHRTGSARRVAPLPLELQERSLEKREREYHERMARKLDRFSEVTHPPLAKLHPDWKPGDAPARVDKPAVLSLARTMRAEKRYRRVLAEKARLLIAQSRLNRVPVYYVYAPDGELFDESTHRAIAEGWVNTHPGYTLVVD